MEGGGVERQIQCPGRWCRAGQGRLSGAPPSEGPQTEEEEGRGGAGPPHQPRCLLRYSSVPFTKNPEKYIKYRVEQVGDMIDRLFDTSA